MQLSTRIAALPARQPLTETLELQLFGTYGSQREHWLGWLSEYDGPGAYGRQDAGRDAKFIYNHIKCAPMLLWLAESLQVERAVLLEVLDAVSNAGQGGARQCAAVRRVIPWSALEPRLG